MGTHRADNFASAAPNWVIVPRESRTYAIQMNPILSDGISQWDSMGYPNGIRWDIPMGLIRVSPLDDGITGISMFFTQSVDRKPWIRPPRPGVRRRYQAIYAVRTDPCRRLAVLPSSTIADHEVATEHPARYLRRAYLLDIAHLSRSPVCFNNCIWALSSS